MLHVVGQCHFLDAHMPCLCMEDLADSTCNWLTLLAGYAHSNWIALAKDFIILFTYNLHIVPDHYSFEKMKQSPVKDTDIFHIDGERRQPEFGLLCPKKR